MWRNAVGREIHTVATAQLNDSFNYHHIYIFGTSENIFESKQTETEEIVKRLHPIERPPKDGDVGRIVRHECVEYVRFVHGVLADNVEALLLSLYVGFIRCGGGSGGGGGDDGGKDVRVRMCARDREFVRICIYTYKDIYIYIYILYSRRYI